MPEKHLVFDQNGMPPLANERGGPSVLPEKLFRYRASLKYIPNEIEELLKQTPRIYNGRAGNFFDSWEIKPILEEGSELAFRQLLREAWELDPDWAFPVGSWKEVVKSGELSGEDVSLLKFNPSLYIPQLRREAKSHLGRARERTRVACFTQTASDTRMWETYGNRGRGVCFEFTLNRKRLNETFNPNKRANINNRMYHNGVVTLTEPSFVVNDYSLAETYAFFNRCAFSEVKYVAEPQRVTDFEIIISRMSHAIPETLEMLRFKYVNDYIHRIFFRKDVSFRDEREWRYVYKRDEDYSDFSPYDLTSVTLGPSASSSFQKRVLRATRNSDVRLYAAKPEHDKFGLYPTPI